jgi:hypothetical protein
MRPGRCSSAAEVRLRARHLAPVLGGFELCSHDALECDPALARRSSTS